MRRIKTHWFARWRRKPSSGHPQSVRAALGVRWARRDRAHAWGLVAAAMVAPAAAVVRCSRALQLAAAGRVVRRAGGRAPSSAARASVAHQPPSAERARRGRGDGAGSGRPPKRKLALFVGYVGSRYNGLQLSSGEGVNGVVTVEGVLRDALLSVEGGGLSEDNAEDFLRKVNWRRSSRTDKGVHSLCTVLSFKCELWPEAAALADAYQGALNDAVGASDKCAELAALAQASGDGTGGGDANGSGDGPSEGGSSVTVSESDIAEASAALSAAQVVVDAAAEALSEQLAEELNTHLPDDVRVFGGMKTAKSFDARLGCVRRGYEYAFPATALPDGGSAEEMARFNAALEVMEGVHPYHNFTKRSQYQKLAAGRIEQAMKKKRAGRRAAGKTDSDCDEAVAESEAAPSAALDTDTDSDTDVDGRRAFFSEQMNDDDMVVKELYRNVTSASAELVPAAESGGRGNLVAVHLKGESFMLHQIRHMVALALAVGAGMLPLECVGAMLCVASRARLPIAPPANLLLRDADFFPFKAPRLKGGVPGYVQQLALPQKGIARRAAFARDVMAPARADPAHDALFVRWAREDLPKRCEMLWEGGLEEVIREHAEWVERRPAHAKGRKTSAGPSGASPIV